MVAFIGIGCAPATPTPAPVPLTVLAAPDLAPVAAALVEAFNHSQSGTRAALLGVSQRQIPTALQQNPGSVAIRYPVTASVGLSETVIALDAIAVGVGITNAVESLTLSQVHQIYAGQASNWANVGGRPETITPLYRDEGSPGREVFERVVMTGTARVTRNALVVASDAGMVDSISAAPGAIGYASLRFFGPQVRPLRLDGMPPSAAAIQQGKYPLVVPVLLVTWGEKGVEARSFLSFVQGKDGQPVLQNLGFVIPR